jgi:antitoxin component YwqK of YwqJK toxin-antitoxin module
VAGELDGPSEVYHENGQLWRKSIYVDGEPDGPGEMYYENGQLQSRGTFNMGQKCGEWIEDGETVTYDPCPPGLADGN